MIPFFVFSAGDTGLLTLKAVDLCRACDVHTQAI